jgi:hypothetical protein
MCRTLDSSPGRVLGTGQPAFVVDEGGAIGKRDRVDAQSPADRGAVRATRLRRLPTRARERNIRALPAC